MTLHSIVLPGMAERSLAERTAPRTYAESRRRVQDTLLMGQRQIEQAKVHTYSETGRLIAQHLLFHNDHAEFGGRVIARLAVDLVISTRLLYQCVQFDRRLPIVRARAQLTWAHYRILAQVEDRTQRKAFEVQAVKNNWTSRELKDRIRPMALPNGAPAATGHPSDPRLKPLAPKRGLVGVYRIDTGRDALVVDLGFISYLDLVDCMVALTGENVICSWF